MSPKKKRKEDKQKNPPEDVAVNLPLDANPISKGTIPSKKAKKKKNPQDEAQKEVHVERKQPKGAIVVAQRTDRVVIAGMKHSFPLGGVCHSFGDLSAKTSGEWTNSLMIPDVLSMEMTDIKNGNGAVLNNLILCYVCFINAIRYHILRSYM
jgi:hypothetical protein